jgi:hypothetical protein
MKDLVEIANFKTKAEAEAAAALLKNEGIPSLIQSQEGMLHGPFYPGATLYVVPEVAERAREVLGIFDEDENETAEP